MALNGVKATEFAQHYAEKSGFLHDEPDDDEIDIAEMSDDYDEREVPLDKLFR